MESSETESLPIKSPDEQVATELSENATSETITGPTETPESTPRVRHWKFDLVLLIVMLGLALVGMGITQSRPNGGWHYWIFLTFAYGFAGILGDVVHAKRSTVPVWKAISSQVFHWLGLLGAMKALFYLEATSVISSEAASVAALMLLALTCVLAGIHLHWKFLIVGGFLAVMTIMIGQLEQYMVMMWMGMMGLAVVGAVVFYLRSKIMASRSRSQHEQPA